MTLTKSGLEEARELAREVKNDMSASPVARDYAEALLDGRVEETSGELGVDVADGIETQLRYLQGNVSSSRAARIAEILGEASETGFKQGYCTVCGTRDEERAAYPRTDADGLVCEGCYEEFGEPNDCTRCGETTYEGDWMRSDEHDGDFFCNTCLMKI